MRPNERSLSIFGMEQTENLTVATWERCRPGVVFEKHADPHGSLFGREVVAVMHPRTWSLLAQRVMEETGEQLDVHIQVMPPDAAHIEFAVPETIPFMETDNVSPDDPMSVKVLRFHASEVR